MTRGVELTKEGGAAVLRRDFGVEKGPPWLATVSEVTGGRRSGGGYSGGRFARTGGDGIGALGGFNARVGEKESEGVPARSCA
jgi:hypothetical protein